MFHTVELRKLCCVGSYHNLETEYGTERMFMSTKTVIYLISTKKTIREDQHFLTILDVARMVPS